MCGIAGIITVEPTSELPGAILRMVRAQAHRGPDDEGTVFFGADGKISLEANDSMIALGSRRLSIIDLSRAGHQPMENEDGSLWIVFNGEIYNFMELRRQLVSKGHRFGSNTDTEGLLHLYEEYGEECQQHLRGMFSFAIWDRKKNSLFIARDRLGKKPLYYSWDGKHFVFASEIKSLLASGLTNDDLSLAGVVSFLNFGYVPAPLTIVEGIQSLLPGHCLVFRNGGFAVRRYWRVVFEEDNRLTEDESVRSIGEILREAVRIRLVADVPLGVFLSGGVDSSAIVALMREATGGTIRTFSVDFEEEEFNEGKYAELVARKYGTEHTKCMVTPKEVLDDLGKIIWAMDQPTIDGVNTYCVSKFTRATGTIVALSGLGGDELFGGYPSFRSISNLCWASGVLARLPGGYLAAEKILGLYGEKGRHHKLKSFLRRPRSYEAGYLAVRGLFLDEALISVLARDFCEDGQHFDPLAYLKGLTAGIPQDSNAVSLLEINAYMCNQLLRDTDAMSMAHSLEVRTPLLDHRLVELVGRIPQKQKYIRTPKGLLLKGLAGILPREIIQRSKATFTFPLGRWLSGHWKGTIEEVIFSKGPDIFDCTGLALWWRAFLQGKVHWSRIWALVVLKLWLERWKVRSPF